MPDPVRRYYERERPIELRPVEFHRYLGEKPRPASSTSGSAPPASCPTIRPSISVLAYASDMTLLDTALMPHGALCSSATFMAASLDHALWFHRPFRADDWLLYAQDSPNCLARAALRAA